MASATDKCSICGHPRANHQHRSYCIVDECVCVGFSEPFTEEELQAYDRAVHQPLGPAEFLGFDYGRG